MKIENKVVSLETAKRLKEKGFPQDTMWEYEYSIFSKFLQMTRDSMKKQYMQRDPGLCRTSECRDTVAAPDAQDIGELLPWYVNKNSVFVGQRMEWRNPNNYTVAYGTLKDIYHSETADSEVEARAFMWLYLKDNNLI